VFTKDPVVAAQLDTLVGSAQSASRIDINSIRSGLLATALGSAGGLDVSPELITSTAGSLVSSLLSDTAEVVTLAPLRGLSVPGDLLRLGPNLEIGRLSEAEVQKCLQVGAARFMGEFGAHVTAHFGVRIRTRSKKRIGDQPDPQMAEAAAAEAAMTNETVAAVIEGLRIFKKGRVSASVVMRYSEDWFQRGALSWGSSTAPDLYESYVLDQAEIDPLLAFWRDLRSRGVSVKSSLRNAIRRLSYAAERLRPDDRLIDLMIAAESLFVSDLLPSGSGDMSYRLALRFSAFVDAPERTRRELFEQMSRASRIRDAIVHGQSPEALTTETGSLEEVVDQIEDYVRLSLKKAILIGARSEGSTFADWDDLVIAEDRRPNAG
jgi:Apea-like HEPN